MEALLHAPDVWIVIRTATTFNQEEAIVLQRNDNALKIALNSLKPYHMAGLLLGVQINARPRYAIFILKPMYQRRLIECESHFLNLRVPMAFLHRE